MDRRNNEVSSHIFQGVLSVSGISLLGFPETACWCFSGAVSYTHLDTIVFSKDRVTQSGTIIILKFGEVKERILKEYSWAGESVGSSQLFMISSGVSILDNNESDNSKDRLLSLIHISPWRRC